MKRFFEQQKSYRRSLLPALIVLVLLVAHLPMLTAEAQTGNIALGKTATASSSENAGTTPNLAVDGNTTGTRWSSAFSDPQWVQIDLGATYTVNHVILRWEAAYAKSYQLQISSDAVNWTMIYNTTTGDGGVDDITGISGTGRYIRMYGTVRAIGYGYSLWEFEVYAASSPTATNTRTSTATAIRTNTPSATNTASTGVPPSCTSTNVALNKTVTSSSNENAGTTPNLAVDGNAAGTRWASAFSDPQWIQIDLGTGLSICRVKLTWEAAYGKSYQIQTSNDAVNWATIYSTITGDGGVDDLTGLTGTGRYIRMYGTVRGTGWGYSLYEFEAYVGVVGTTTVTNTATRTASPTRTVTSTQPPTFQPATSTPTATGSQACPTTNFAAGRPVTASSVIGAGGLASFAIDGNATTRWESAWSDPQWIQLDFGTTANFCRVKLNWEAAAASAYQIQTSTNGTTWTTIYNTATSTGGVQDLTVSGSGRYIRMYGTARTTVYGYSLWEFEVYGTGGVIIPTITPTPTPDTAFWGDTSGIPAAQNVLMFKFLNRTNGKYPDSQVYWSFNGTVHSIAEQPYFDMPANSSGRMYFYLGSPTSQYNDFIEFTIGPDIFNGNTTRVDAFGLKLAMRLHTHDGYDTAVGEDLTTFYEDRAVTFQKFVDEVPAEFKHLAQIQYPYRIPAPAHMGETDFLPSGQYGNYFASYLASVGSSATTADVFGCTNTLGEDAGQCAAFNRHVAQLPQSQWFDTSTYYKANPANWYAKFWHDHSLDKLSYGFPYDDYANQSSFITHGDPQYLIIAVGW